MSSAPTGGVPPQFALAAHTFALADELDGTGVTVNVLHPATFMDTAMVREADLTPWNTVADGAAALLAPATRDAGTGRHCDGTRPARAHEAAFDPRVRTRPAAVTDQLVRA